MEEVAFYAAVPHIGREANLLFEAVDVLCVVPNQLASIVQATDETVSSSERHA